MPVKPVLFRMHWLTQMQNDPRYSIPYSNIPATCGGESVYSACPGFITAFGNAHRTVGCPDATLNDLTRKLFRIFV